MKVHCKNRCKRRCIDISWGILHESSLGSSCYKNVVCKYFLLFALLYYRLTDEIRVDLPQHCGRFAWQSSRRASLPQQALMEMLIYGITNKEEICGDADEPNDIEEWKCVEIK